MLRKEKQTYPLHPILKFRDLLEKTMVYFVNDQLNDLELQ